MTSAYPLGSIDKIRSRGITFNLNAQVAPSLTLDQGCKVWGELRIGLLAAEDVR